jgi:hypothetical protein
MSKQQTAVEWLLENMPEDYMASIPYELAEQAIQMEREQIENAYWEGGQDVPINENRCAEYYEQTYGTTKSR